MAIDIGTLIMVTQQHGALAEPGARSDDALPRFFVGKAVIGIEACRLHDDV